jgi:hypothetical protein
MPACLSAIMMMLQFSPSRWTVDLLLEQRRELCPTSVSMLRESLLPGLSFSANKLALGLILLRALGL